ncbi:ROK family protein [Planosporangium thailandense]|uniref:ROK family protein n=1 Tax=Planosporangium thailandense TaxID=765197 RepID=A0ABX0Y2J7_9ACTN|nr:ROK family protein [Planosporangium thailandense]
MSAESSTVATVLRSLLDCPAPASRGELAARCALSRPTAFAAVDRLMSLGLVAQAGQRAGGPGRTATLYDLDPRVGLIAGVDIGGSNTRAAVCDVRGRVLAETRVTTDANGGGAVARQSARLVAGLLAKVEPDAPLLVTGVSVPGVVDPRNGTVSLAPNIGQREPYDLLTLLTERLGTTVLIDNNVNLAALGEQRQGAARELETFVVVSVGAGVGAGIVHRGTLLRGARGAAGEITLAPLRTPPHVPDSDVDDAGALALLRAAADRDDWKVRAPGTVLELFELAAAGEPPAVELVEGECQRVGEIIATLCAVVDPEAILLAGGLGGNRLLLEGAVRVARRFVSDLPPVLPSKLGERASLVGAIGMASEHATAQLAERAASVPIGSP